jgi:uncharacterized membrane protein YdjX (TVP38/TMEM64 family)
VPKLLRIAALLAAVAGLLLLGRALGGYIEPFRSWVEGLGVLGPAVFVLGYAAAVVAFVPGSALTLAGGAIFGVVKGTLLVFVAAVLGSSAAFVIARYFARSAVERRMAGNLQFAAIDRAIGREGRKIAFLLRLSPAIPFVLLNYALGLTRIRFADALLASAGMLPGTLLYVYLGSVAGDAASASAGGAELGQTLVKAVGLGATALVTIYVTVLARRALREATAEAGE